jgi:hypothetical protein
MAPFFIVQVLHDRQLPTYHSVLTVGPWRDWSTANGTGAGSAAAVETESEPDRLYRAESRRQGVANRGLSGSWALTGQRIGGQGVPTRV